MIKKYDSMKSILLPAIICLFTLVFVTACENGDFLWEGETYARLIGPENYTLGTDSMTFTFSTHAADVTEFTAEAHIVIIGKVAAADRKVNLKVNEGKSTAVPGTHYQLSTQLTIPAGEREVFCPIVLKRAPELEGKSVRLHIEVVASDEIGVGVNEWNALTIVWNDMISKPLNWENLTEFFGEYSEIKYRFIISTLGITQFTYGDSGGMSWGEMNNYRLMMITALNAYNEANPSHPLTDENNQLVSF